MAKIHFWRFFSVPISSIQPSCCSFFLCGNHNDIFCQYFDQNLHRSAILSVCSTFLLLLFHRLASVRCSADAWGLSSFHFSPFFRISSDCDHLKFWSCCKYGAHIVASWCIWWCILADSASEETASALLALYRLYKSQIYRYDGTAHFTVCIWRHSGRWKPSLWIRPIQITGRGRKVHL